MDGSLRANWPTPDFRIGPRGWTTDGLVAHLQTVFAVAPSGRSQRVVCRSRLAWPRGWTVPTGPWRFGWRPPGQRRQVAVGCSVVAPVASLPLLRTPDGGLAPDPAVVLALRQWCAALQVNAPVAIVAGFPVQTADGATVPLTAWLPQLWLTEADPDDDDGVGIAAVIDRSLPGQVVAQQVGALLSHTAWPSPERRSLVVRQPELHPDLSRVAARLGLANSPLNKAVIGWPRDYDGHATAADLVQCAALRRPDAWLVDAELPGHQFLCASPELLVAVLKGRVSSLALAGTRDCAGSEGAQTDREHAVVADYIAGVFQALGIADVTATAEVRSNGPLTHRATAFEAVRPPNVDALTLAAHLHPTPALLGAPRATALSAVTAAEAIARHWYGGFAGVLAADGSGNGELVAVLRGVAPTASGWQAWAGAGLVAGCDPAAEAQEIERKHAAIADAFGLLSP